MSGCLTPLRKDKKTDYANGSGALLRASMIEQLLCTKKGELYWWPEFGLRLHLLLHRNNSDTLREEAFVEVREGLDEFFPDVELIDVKAKADDEKLYITVETSFETVAATIEEQP